MFIGKTPSEARSQLWIGEPIPRSASVESAHVRQPVVRTERDASGRLTIPMRDEDRVVIARKPGHFAIEILECQIDADGSAIFEKELARDGDVDRRMNMQH